MVPWQDEVEQVLAASEVPAPSYKTPLGVTYDEMQKRFESGQAHVPVFRFEERMTQRHKPRPLI